MWSESQFRSRVGEDRYQELFDDIVSQARARGLVKDRLRIKDATHIIANIAIPSTIGLVARARDRLLDSAGPYASRRAEEEEKKADQFREATADLKDEERLMQRVARLREICDLFFRHQIWLERGLMRLWPLHTRCFRIGKIPRERSPAQCGRSRCQKRSAPGFL